MKSKKQLIRGWVACNFSLILVIVVKHTVDYLVSFLDKMDHLYFTNMHYNISFIVIGSIISILSLIYLLSRKESKFIGKIFSIVDKANGHVVRIVIFVLLYGIVFMFNNYLIWTFEYSILPLFLIALIFFSIIILCKDTNTVCM